VEVAGEGVVSVNSRRTRGESSASTERDSRAVFARFGVGKGMFRVLFPGERGVSFCCWLGFWGIGSRWVGLLESLDLKRF
jgi:hypothetical protein